MSLLRKVLYKNPCIRSLCTCICIRVCICIYVCICMYNCTCIYISATTWDTNLVFVAFFSVFAIESELIIKVSASTGLVLAKTAGHMYIHVHIYIFINMCICLRSYICIHTKRYMHTLHQATPHCLHLQTLAGTGPGPFLERTSRSFSVLAVESESTFLILCN